MPWNKTDRAFKTLINKRTTDSDLKFYFNEFGDYTLDINAQEIKTDVIPSTPPSSDTSVVKIYTLFTLTQDITVDNAQAWYASFSGARLKDWISDKYNGTGVFPGYSIKIFDSSNREITVTDQSGWFFDYPTGILTFNGANLDPATDGTPRTVLGDSPFKITGYRYIGSKGAFSTATVQGSGTVNYIPLWQDTITLTNSIISQSSGVISIAGAVSATGNLLITNASGGIQFTATTGSTITAGIRQSSGGQIIDFGANTSGIGNRTAGAEGGYFRVNTNNTSNLFDFHYVNSSNIDTSVWVVNNSGILNTGIIPVARISGTLLVPGGGTGLTSVPYGSLIYGSASSTLNTLTISPYPAILSNLYSGVGTNWQPTWIDYVPISLGGTGLTTIGVGDILYGSLTEHLNTVTMATSPSVFVNFYNGTYWQPIWENNIDVALGGTGLSTSTYGDILFGSSGTSLNTLSAPSGTSVLIANNLGSGYRPSWASSLDVGRGGTGRTSFNAGAIIYGAGSTSALNSVATATGNSILIASNPGGGYVPSWVSILDVGRGGTGIASASYGTLLWGAGTTTPFNTLATLSSEGVLVLKDYGSGYRPDWVAALPVTLGGTGLTTVTAGAIPFGSSSTALNSDATHLFFNATSRSLGVGTNSPTGTLQVIPYSSSYRGLVLTNSSGNSNTIFAAQTSDAVDRITIDSTGVLNLLPISTSAGGTNPVKFYELAANGTNFVALKAADSMASSTTFIWPNTPPPGSDSVLQAGAVSGGVSALSWTTVSGGIPGTALPLFLSISLVAMQHGNPSASDRDYFAPEDYSEYSRSYVDLSKYSEWRVVISASGPSGTLTPHYKDPITNVWSNWASAISFDNSNASSDEGLSLYASGWATIPSALKVDNCWISIEDTAPDCEIYHLEYQFRGTALAVQGADGTPGTPGADGASIIWRGTWASATAYAVLNAVYYGGKSWICTSAHTSTVGQSPDIATTYWSLMVSGAGGIGDPVNSGTAGSVLFVGTSNLLSQNNSKFFWDNTNFRLGIGTASPVDTLDVRGGKIMGGTYASTSGYRVKLDLSSVSGNPVAAFSMPSTAFGAVGESAIVGSADLYFQAVPSSTANYGVFEAYTSAGMVLGTGGNANPIIFQINRNERARLTNQYLQFSPYGTSANNTYGVRFLELAANGSSYIALKAPDNITGSGGTLTYILPAAAPTSGQTLSATAPSAGLVSLSWATPTSITIGPSGSLQSGPNITLATGTSGTDFAIVASSNIITFNIPDASGSNRGLVTTGTQTIAGAKTFTSGINISNTTGMHITFGTSATAPASSGQFVFDGTNLKIYNGAVKTIAYTDTTITGNATNVTGVVAAANGGTGQSTYTVGDMLYASGTTTLSKLGIGSTNGAILMSNGSSAPSWVTTFPATSYSFTGQNFNFSPFGVSAGNTSQIRFLELAANGTSYVGFRAPDNLTGFGGTLVYVYPQSAPTVGQYLSASAPSGGVVTLSWATVTAGLLIKNATISQGTATSLDFSSAFSATVSAGAGAIGIAAGGIGTTELANLSVTGAKIASSTIDLTKLSASGTPSSSTYLRGDNTWATLPTGGISSITAGTGLSGGTITTSGTIGISAGGVSATELASNAVTTAKILDSNVTTAKIADGAVTTLKISDANVTGVKIANGAVDTNQLATVNASPGTYTLSTVVVDAKGRVTSASSGSATSALPTRQTVTATTGSLANGASADLNISNIGKACTILKISTNAAAWVRIYSTSSYRTADSSRSITVDPTGQHGVLLEAITTGSLLSLDATQNITTWSAETSPVSFCPMRVTNISGSTTTITVTLSVIIYEQ